MKISSVIGKSAVCISLFSGFIASASAALSSQTVTGSYWWVDGDELTSDGAGKIDPVRGTVTDRTPKAEFSALLADGQRVLSWTRYVGTNPSLPLSFEALPGADGQNPLAWTKNDEYGSTVTLGLVTTWIKYKLAYEGGATTEELFTNRVTIADCTAKRTGYSFSLWTNSVGTTFKSGESKGGADFNITNHDDQATVALYPKWTANWCTIAYKLEGGAPGASHPGTAEYDQEIVVSDPLRTGYGLKEWTITPKPSESGSRIVRGNGETRFTNLFTEDGTTVTLTAVWTNCKYRVDFNHWGAESGPNPMIVTYDEAYMPIIIPKKSGSTFLGYYTAATDGDLLWDGEGQPAREKWDIASDQMAHARWEAETYYLKYDANGGTGEISSQLITNGVSVTLSDGSGLSFSGCTLLGWARDSKAAAPEFALGASRTFNEATTLYAVWQVSYFLSFDGHGATSGKMPVEMFVRGEEKPLPANAFEKTGYTFGGWAESAEKADALVKKYEDRQLVKDVSDISGSTNTLFAVWNTNTYCVAFDKGSGSGEPMETMAFVYDQTQRLAKCTYAPPHELYGFAGWQDGITGELIPDEAVVSNLCAEANATNTLVAKWALDLGDLSEHMHCETLKWWNNTHGTIAWETFEGPTYGCTNTGSCVGQAGGSYAGKNWLEAVVRTNGTLTFSYKWEKSTMSDKESMTFAYGFAKSVSDGEFNTLPSGGPNAYGTPITVDKPDEWRNVTIPVLLGAEAEQLVLRVVNEDADGANRLFIDQMKWEPEGGFPDLPVTTNAVPVAATGLVYDGTEKTGVKPGIGYTLVGNAATDAGEYEATATPLEGYVWEGGFAGSTNIAWSIAKGTKDVSDVTFPDASFEYDGKPHSFGVVGEIPDGVEVVYEGETNRTEVGTNVVTASFRLTDAKNWNEIGTKLTAKLIVNPQDVPPIPPEPVITNAVPVALTGIVYDGNVKTGVVEGAGYTLVGNVATNAGAYVATATLPEKGYVWEGGSSAPTNIAWSIAKGTKDVSGVTFPDASFEYDGKPHSFGVVGEVPDGVEVVYEGETNRTEVGTNVVTASFRLTDAKNWNEIGTKLTARLIVNPQDVPPEPPDPTKGYVNVYFMATLEELGATAVPTDHKITIKAEGLPKGLKLVTKAIKEGRTVVGYAYTVEGVPTETMDGVTCRAYVRVTDNKVQTLHKLDLSVRPAEDYEQCSFPDGTNGVAYVNYSVTKLWPDVSSNAANWTISGLPSGLKYAQKAVTAKKKIDGVNVTVTNAQPYEVYGTPTKPGRFTVKAVEKIAGTSYKTTHVATLVVWPAEPEPEAEWTNQAYVAIVNRMSAADVTAASGLPSGVKFTAKDGLFYGTPTKAGTSVVTLTHEDKSKTQFFWTITPADVPAFALKLTETAVDPQTVKATIRQGVAYEWAVTNTLGSKVSASGLPTGLKLVSTAVKDGTKTVGYTYVVKGVPTKAGEFYSVFKTTMNGVTTATSAAFTVLDLPAWAQGTFNGGSEIAQVSFTVSKAGKVSGKYLESGIAWTLSAASYDRYDAELSNYVAVVVCKSGSGKSAVAFTNELTVTCAAAGGWATNEFFVAYQNNWKVEPWKTIAKAFPKGGEIVLRPGIVGTNDTVSLKFASSGNVTVKAKIEKSVSASGKVSYYSASGSAALCPLTVPDVTTGAFEGVVFVYLPPKAKTPLASGYSACVPVQWDGTQFALGEDDE